MRGPAKAEGRPGGRSRPTEVDESSDRLPSVAELVHDWNEVSPPRRPKPDFDLFDETLRDGVQSPSVTDPPLEEKVRLLELMEAVGVRAADLGLPGAGRRAFDSVVAEARYIRERRLEIEPCCAGRTLIEDVRPAVEAAQRSGGPLTLYLFIGSSPIRQWAEQWTLDFLLEASASSIDFAVREGLKVAYVTEDTTRSSPVHLDALFRNALDHGASRLVLCDTVGHATPHGARALVNWTQALLESIGSEAKVDWHGHNDRSFGVVNALAALEAGVDRVHACGLGIGERVGNTSMDLTLVNLKLLGWIDQDLSRLAEYVDAVSEACRFDIPITYPLFGADAFRTATGVHAAAIIKARARGDDWLADRIYSGVPAGEFGRRQEIEVSHMSGMSNVRYWLEERGYPSSDEICLAILARAKAAVSTLSELEILEVIARFATQRSGRLPGAQELT